MRVCHAWQQALSAAGCTDAHVSTHVGHLHSRRRSVHGPWSALDDISSRHGELSSAQLGIYVAG
eukprot:3252797-Prymnesium_polylepis.1